MDSGKIDDKELNNNVPDINEIINQDNLKLIGDFIPVAIVQIDADERYLYVNKSYEKLFGITSDKILGKQVRNILDHEAYLRAFPFISKALTGEKVTFENTQFDFDGQIRYVRISYIPNFKNYKSEGYFAIIEDITEYKKTAQKVRELNDALSEAQSFIKVGNLLCDFEKRQIFLSQEFYNIFEINEVSTIEQYNAAITSCIHPDDYERTVLRNQNFIPDNVEIFSDEFRVIMSDGRIKWVLYEGKIIEKKNGKSVKIAVNVQEITARKETDIALKESEEKYRSLYDTMIDSHIEAKIDGEIVMINPAFLKKLGYKDKLEIIGKDSLQLFWVIPEDRTRLFKVISKNGYALNFRTQIRKKDGMLLHIEGNARLKKDKNGVPISVSSILRDITEQLNFENDIKLNNDRLNALLHIAQLKEISLKMLFDYSVHQAARLTKSKYGFIFKFDETTEQVKLLSWCDVDVEKFDADEINSEYQIDARKLLQNAILQRRPNYDVGQFQLKLYKTNGNEIICNINNYLVIPFFIENKIASFVCVANKEGIYNDSDIIQLLLLAETVWAIVERKEDEEKLIKYTNELKELNQSKDQLISIISHDLRNPFNSILGFAELLQTNVDKYPPEKIRKMVSIIYDSTKSTLLLLENLLDWAKSHTSKKIIRPVSFSITDLFEELTSTMFQLATLKNVTIKHFLSENLKITTDRNMISAVLRNLIMNAIKYSNNGGTISICAFSSDTMIEFLVTDEGVGIEKEVLETLFLLTENISTPGTASEKGSGLGLVLCKEFTGRLGGAISVESSIGVGTTFKVVIPSELKNL